MALTMTRPPDDIVISDYDPAWPEMFAVERALLQEAIGQWAVAIEHVGSTAVPGLGAKPIIDIGIALENLLDALKCISPLTYLGYDCKGEFGIPDRIYFRKATQHPIHGQIYDGVGRTHQIHMYRRDHEQFIWQVAFRDYLRAHPDARQEYEELKRKLAAEHDNVETYSEAKSDFVQAILRKAGVPEKVR